MDKFLLLSSSYIPATNTQAYTLLSILSDGENHTKQNIMCVLGDDPRSPLQALRGEKYGFWLIHNTGIKKGQYQLDQRHLTGDINDDHEARLEAEIILRKRSRKQAEHEIARYPLALAAEEKALIQQSFEFTNKPRNSNQGVSK